MSDIEEQPKYPDPFADPAELATRNGWTIVQAEPWELFVDLDVPSEEATEALLKVANRADRLNRHLPFAICLLTTTKGPGGNIHVYLRCQDKAAGHVVFLPAMTRIALQAVLGSDLDRELYNIVRDVVAETERGEAHRRPNVIFYETTTTRSSNAGA